VFSGSILVLATVDCSTTTGSAQAAVQFDAQYGTAYWIALDGTPLDPAAAIEVGYVTASEVSNRILFYNNSSFDGNDPTANVNDDLAIATDKTALLPGQTAGFANYTSFSKGINGIMVDIAGLPGTPTLGDFAFKMGNNGTPGSWADAPTPSGLSIRAGAGLGGSDRITMTWLDNQIQKQWLQVTVKATGNTGLAADDVFYFGNAIGECGNDPANAIVNVTDVALTRANPRSPLTPAPVTFAYDYNRDGLVNVTDTAICRANQTSPLTVLFPLVAP
jgi:hypothetical protein